MAGWLDEYQDGGGVSPEYTERLKTFENRPTNLHYHTDNKGIPTIGWGHRITDEELKKKAVKIGDKWVPFDNFSGKQGKVQADKLIQHDIDHHFQRLERQVGKENLSKFDPNVVDVLFDIVYNRGSLGKSHDYIKKGDAAGLKSYLSEAASELKGGAKSRMQWRAETLPEELYDPKKIFPGYAPYPILQDNTYRPPYISEEALGSNFSELKRGGVIPRAQVGKTISPRDVGTISNYDDKPTWEKAQSYVLRNTIGLRKWMDDVGAPALALASLGTPLNSLGTAYLINELEENNLPGEAGNVIYNKIINQQNYASEAAGGLIDFKQAAEEAAKGNWWRDKEGKFGAIPNFVWGTSGVLEPNSGLPKFVDNVIERTKLAGDLYDVVEGVKKQKGGTIPKAQNGISGILPNLPMYSPTQAVADNTYRQPIRTQSTSIQPVYTPTKAEKERQKQALEIAAKGVERRNIHTNQPVISPYEEFQQQQAQKRNVSEIAEILKQQREYQRAHDEVYTDPQTGKQVIQGIGVQPTASPIDVATLGVGALYSGGVGLLGSMAELANPIPISINSIGKLFKPRRSSVYDGLEFIKDWYSHPDINKRFYSRNDPQLLETWRSEIFKKLDEYVPKNYIDLLADKGRNEYLKYNISTGGLSYGVPKEIYINNTPFIFNKKAKEAVRVHELTHLIEKNGANLFRHEEELLQSAFDIDKPSSFWSKLKDKMYNKEYYTTPTEIHARMNQVRFQLNKQPSDIFTLEDYDKIKKLNDWEGMGRFIKDKERFVDIMNNFWEVSPYIGVGGAASMINKNKSNTTSAYKEGGVVKDNTGYWNPDNWGKPVEIGSNQITMQGVNQPLVGISDTGDTQMMYPGQDYHFKGKSVTEFPIAQDGETISKRFLQPNDPKLPKGKIHPLHYQYSTERASSIGGEQGEPAYLIPTFKYGNPLDNPLEEFRKTGEHLGGPFDTWQEAEEWEKNVRHPYVEKGQSIPSPYKRSSKYRQGGNVSKSKNKLESDSKIANFTSPSDRWMDGITL